MDTCREPEFERILKAWESALDQFFSEVSFKPYQILVLGCSTSEVLGQRIGQSGSQEVAEMLFQPLHRRVLENQLYLAVQGCEHINRALVIEEECANRYNLEEVTVLPSLKAGGAMTEKAWTSFKSPVMVEQLSGHAGIDVGDTFIGMHLRPVVVPVRIQIKSIGAAHLTMAKTRPRLIGGPRAVYPG